MREKDDIVSCIGVLKNLPRTGWLQRGVPPGFAEDVASHSFEASLLAGMISGKLADKGYKVSVEKSIALAVLHDIGECIIGDLTPVFSEMAAGVKENVEKKAVERLLGEERRLLHLYEEWLEGSSIEALIARISDRLATIIQATRYAEVGFKEMSDILKSSREDIDRLVKKSGIPELLGVVESFIPKNLKD